MFLINVHVNFRLVSHFSDQSPTIRYGSYLIGYTESLEFLLLCLQVKILIRLLIRR